MNEHPPPEETRSHQIACLRRVIEQLRLNLYTLDEQAALYGPLDVPLHLKNSIEDVTKQLAHREAQLRELQGGEGSRLSENRELKRFWEPFVSEGALFITPHEETPNAPGTRMKVLVLTMQGVFNMYRLLLELFANSHDVSRVRLDLGGAVKQDSLANYLMCQFKGLSLGDGEKIVRQGYIFRTSGDYLGSPFIVSDEGLNRYSPEEQLAMQELGIYDLRPGQPSRFFPRTFGQYGVPSYKDNDCAIIVTGWASLPGENRVRRVVIIAGHSRHSTLSATAFVTTNEEWAQQANLLSYFNTETIIGPQPDPASAPVAPSILANLREIKKQSTQI